MVIREMTANDSQAVLDMMRVFYASPALLVKSPEDVLKKDIENCVGACPYVEGYVFEQGQDVCGYAMVARGFSTEYGGLCLWIEDLYIKPGHRGAGLGRRFLEFIREKYRDDGVRIRLEVEKNNKKAIHLYEKCGYETCHYQVMSMIIC